MRLVQYTLLHFCCLTDTDPTMRICPHNLLIAYKHRLLL